MKSTTLPLPILFISAIFLISGCASGTTQQSKQTDKGGSSYGGIYKTFEASDYSIDYPASWEKQSVEGATFFIPPLGTLLVNRVYSS